MLSGKQGQQAHFDRDTVHAVRDLGTACTLKRHQSTYQYFENIHYLCFKYHYMKHPLLILLLALSAIFASCSNSSEQTENSTLATIMSRKSVRSYTEQKLTDAQIETLLKAAMAAPSGINIQPWRFIVVTDQQTKEALQADSPQRMYSQCAALFVICGETDFINRNGDKVPNGNWTADCAAATENLLLAAESIGLGAVWTACYPYENRMNVAIDVLGIPEGVTPYCLVPVGYPAGDEQPKDKWKPENIHYNRW